MKIDEILEKYNLTTKAIVADYIGDAEMQAELTWAFEKLQKQIKELTPVKAAPFKPTFENLFALLEKLPAEEVDCDALLEFCKGKIYDPESALALLSREAVKDLMTENGHIVIECNNIALRTKLEEFLYTEIYPHYNDQQKFVNM